MWTKRPNLRSDPSDMSDTATPAADPFDLFNRWMADAEVSEPSDPNAMTVVTVDAEGRPSARILLLKGADRDGFVFYTNKQSRKADDLAVNSHTALLFHWKSIARQIRIEGPVSHATDAEADAYFASRHRISRLGAWASDQSRPLPSRAELERRLAEYEAKYPGDTVPRPPHWSGYRVTPRHFEFWQDMPYRLHDRTIYDRQPDGAWSSSKLYP